MSAMEAILMEEFKKKEKLNRRDYWLCENIIVKVMNKDLADGRYYKQKGKFFEFSRNFTLKNLIIK